jgi:hypothetical protein
MAYSARRQTRGSIGRRVETEKVSNEARVSNFELTRPEHLLQETVQALDPVPDEDGIGVVSDPALRRKLES